MRSVNSSESNRVRFMSHRELRSCLTSNLYEFVRFETHPKGEFAVYYAPSRQGSKFVTLNSNGFADYRGTQLVPYSTFNDPELEVEFLKINQWGTHYTAVEEGYCKECEFPRPNGFGHYSNCKGPNWQD